MNGPGEGRAPGGRRLPFQEILEELRALGHPVGVDDYEALAKLLARYDGASRDDLRTAIGATLGRDQDGVRRVHRLFDRLYPVEVEAIPEDAPAAVRRRAGRRRRRGLYAALGIVGAIAVGAAATLLWLLSPRGAGALAGDLPSVSRVPSAALPTPVNPTVLVQYGRGAQCDRPPSAFAVFGPRAWLATGILALAAVGLASARVTSRSVAIGRARRDRFATSVGPRRYTLPPTVAASVDARPMHAWAATIREALRASRAARTARIDGAAELDVDRTVQRTAEAGLRPEIVARTARGTSRLLVLEQAGPLTAAYRASFDAFVDCLRGAGLAVERRFFVDDWRKVSAARGGRPAPLATVRDEGEGLVVLSTGELVPTSRVELDRRLARWPARVLLTPIEDRSRWPATLTKRTSSLPTFSLDAAGVRDAAIVLRGGPPPAKQTVRRPLPSQVLRLQAMLAMTGQPSFELAERLRARFLPRAPADVLRGVEGVVRGGASSDEAREALRWLRESDPEGSARVEREVRGFVVELLDAARPADAERASVAALRWRLDRAMLDVHLGAGGQTELRELATGPLRAEVDARITQEIADSPADAAKDLLLRVQRELEAIVEPGLASIGLARRVYLRRPSLARLGAALGVACALGWSAGALPELRAPLDASGGDRTMSEGEVFRQLCALDSVRAARPSVPGSSPLVLVGTMPGPGGSHTDVVVEIASGVLGSAVSVVPGRPGWADDLSPHDAWQQSDGLVPATMTELLDRVLGTGPDASEPVTDEPEVVGSTSSGPAPDVSPTQQLPPDNPTQQYPPDNPTQQFPLPVESQKIPPVKTSVIIDLPPIGYCESTPERRESCGRWVGKDRTLRLFADGKDPRFELRPTVKGVALEGTWEVQKGRLALSPEGKQAGTRICGLLDAKGDVLAIEREVEKKPDAVCFKLKSCGKACVELRRGIEKLTPIPKKN